jgi:hypothetical protein
MLRRKNKEQWHKIEELDEETLSSLLENQPF